MIKMLKVFLVLLMCYLCNGKVHFPGNYFIDLRRNHRQERNETTVANTEIVTPKSIPDVIKVDIKLYYETLCPASVEFLTKQLQPVVERLGSYLDVHLIPFGHAEVRHFRNHRYMFRCQHGPPECFGNKLHACAIHVLDNATEAVIFNSCLMRNTHYDYITGQYDFNAALTWCGAQHSENKDHLIRHCSNSRRGSELLKLYGDQTKLIHPAYVPYVVIDDSIDRQDHALSNLMMTVCSILHPMPPQCFTRR